MARKNPWRISLAAVFRVPPESQTAEVGRALLAGALADPAWKKQPSASVEIVLAKRLKAWLGGEALPAFLDGHPELAGSNLTLQTYWYEAIPELQLAIPLGPGEKLFGIVAKLDGVTERSPSHVLEFFVRRLEAAAAALRPVDGYADAYERVGFGEADDPRARPHWLTFREGRVERAWPDPFRPPAELARPRAARAPKARAPPGRVELVAGVDATAGGRGVSLLDRFEAGELGAPGRVRTGETAVERFARWLGERQDLGALRPFVSADGETLVLGVPVRGLPTSGRVSHEGPIGAAEIEAALAASALDLGRLRAQEPRVHLVWRSGGG